MIECTVTCNHCKQDIIRGKFATKNKLTATVRGGDIEPGVVKALLEHHDDNPMVIPFTNERVGGHNEMSAFDENEDMIFLLKYTHMLSPQDQP